MSEPSSPSPPTAIAAEGVVKTFGPVIALNQVSLTVAPGTLAALLGPNGAGKTTLVRIIATLIRPDAGHVRVLGRDAVARPAQVRGLIGLTGQYAGLDEAITGRDNLVLIGRLAGLRRRQAAERAAQLADVFGLTEAVGRVVRTYSGGMRRRLDLAASLMTRPAVLVLDEPTTALDPVSRQQLWDVLAQLRDQGTTMLLTTQYLEEADRFADMVYVLDHGAITAAGTAAQLKERVSLGVVEIRTQQPGAAHEAARALAGRLPSLAGAVWADDASGRVRLPAAGGAGTLLAAAAALQAAGIAVADLAIRQPSLDEAFFALTRGAATSGGTSPDGARLARDPAARARVRA